jgi:hypothetical protein
MISIDRNFSVDPKLRLQLSDRLQILAFFELVRSIYFALEAERRRLFFVSTWYVLCVVRAQ